MQKSNLFTILISAIITLFLITGLALAEDALYINENGNVGIGTTEPTNGKLEINGEGVNQGLTIYNGVSGSTFRMYRKSNVGYLTRAGDDTKGIAIKADGKVGIGTTSPDAKLNIQGGTDVAPSTSYPGYIVVGDLQGYNIGIDDNEIMARNNGSSASLYLQHEGGNLYLQGTLWSSDLRLKENVYTIEKSLDKISKLRGVSFEWLDKSRDKDQHMGLIAQEVEDVFPESVETDEDGNKAIAYIDLIAPLIESVKELKAEKDVEIEMLVEQIEGLTLSLIEMKKENEKIKQELAELKK